MFTDHHMHTKSFSSDAVQTIDELIEGAVKQNIHQVAITEHWDMDYPHKDEIFEFDLNEYYEAFFGWKELSLKKNGPNLLMGIEIGWQEHLKERINSTVSTLPFDVVLLSEHLFRGSDIFYSKECPKLSRKERNAEYLTNLVKMCKQIDCFDILAHYDYINRYIEDPDSFVFYDDCPKLFDELFEVLIKKQKALEINTMSINAQIKKGSPYTMPDPKIIKRYLDMGGELITIGSDAHDSCNIGNLFKETAEYLKSLGVKSTFYFEKRKPLPDPEFQKDI